MQDSLNAIYECKKPVIALIDGFCYGGGKNLQIYLYFSFRSRFNLLCRHKIVLEKSRIFDQSSYLYLPYLKEIDLGFAADLGTLQRLPICISNSGIALELSMTGRVWDALEAKEHGFIQGAIYESNSSLQGLLF